MVRLFTAGLTQFEGRMSSGELEYYVSNPFLLNIKLDLIIDPSFGSFNSRL
jgi:hypothetical protein